MIKTRKVSVATDPRGKITTGMKRPGSELPMSTDYFVIDDFPELVAVYGPKPTTLLVMPPADNISEIFDDNFVLWGGKPDHATKVRQCDGETCLHRIAETIGTESFGAGEETECTCKKLDLFESTNEQLKRKACKYSMYFRAFVANPNTRKIDSTLPFLFQTHSLNSGSNIHSALENMAGLTAMITGGTVKLGLQEFQLSVKMVEAKFDAKQKFPIWNLTPVGTIAMILDRMVKVAHVLGWDEEIQKNLIAQKASRADQTGVKEIASGTKKVDLSIFDGKE
jgi:hypothetical protein